MTPEAMTAVIDSTWPAERYQTLGPWLLRFTAGAGSRVSAASAFQPGAETRIEQAEDAMRAGGQSPLFMVRSGEEALDTALEARGYKIKDPVSFYTAPIAALTAQRPPPVTCFEVWPPLEAEREIWAAGGIGPARLAVMDRVTGPKTTIFGRIEDTPAGVLFVACHGDIAMVHAVETARRFRRKGLGRHMMTAAAFWARDNCATTLSLLVTKANVGANALYASLGMVPVGEYHYRIRTDQTDDR